MEIPLQITYRHMEPSPALSAKIEERAQALDQAHHHVMSCRVVVEQDHSRHHQGNFFRVSVDVKVPGHEVAVSRNPGKNDLREDPYVAVRDAFDAARRQLEDIGRKMRQEVKFHEPPPHGRVSALDGDAGRIATADGRDIYFHRNSVVTGSFEGLEVGSEVRFSEEAGDDGPQASSVHVVGKHHVVG